MPNLKAGNYTLRGKIGELIARSHIPFSSRVQELSPKYLYKRFSFGFIPTEKRAFLIRNWRSFDLIRLVTSGEGTKLENIEIYEVKTQSSNREHKLEITEKSLMVYKQAKKLGIIPKSVKIIFNNEWEYEIEIKNFEEDDFSINNGSEKSENYLNFLKESALLNRKVRGT